MFLARIYDSPKTGLLSLRTKFKLGMGLLVYSTLKMGFIIINNKSVPTNFLDNVPIFTSSWVIFYKNSPLWEESGKGDRFDWKLTGLRKRNHCHCNHFLGIYHNILYQAKILSVDATKNYFQTGFIRRLSVIHGIHEWETREVNLEWGSSRVWLSKNPNKTKSSLVIILPCRCYGSPHVFIVFANDSAKDHCLFPIAKSSNSKERISENFSFACQPVYLVKGKGRGLSFHYSSNKLYPVRMQHFSKANWMPVGKCNLNN